MSTMHRIPDNLRQSYRVDEWRNAAGILSTARWEQWAEIIAALRRNRGRGTRPLPKLLCKATSSRLVSPSTGKNGIVYDGTERPLLPDVAPSRPHFANNILATARQRMIDTSSTLPGWHRRNDFHD